MPILGEQRFRLDFVERGRPIKRRGAGAPAADKSVSAGGATKGPAWIGRAPACASALTIRSARSVPRSIGTCRNLLAHRAAVVGRAGQQRGEHRDGFPRLSARRETPSIDRSCRAGGRRCCRCGKSSATSTMSTSGASTRVSRQARYCSCRDGADGVERIGGLRLLQGRAKRCRGGVRQRGERRAAALGGFGDEAAQRAGFDITAML